MNLSPKIWWLLPAICLLLGALAGLALQQAAGMPWTLALKEGGILALVTVLSATLLMILVCNYPTKVGILVYAIMIGLLTGIAAAWMHQAISEWIFSMAERRYLSFWNDLITSNRWTLYPLLLVLFSVTLGLYRKDE